MAVPIGATIAHTGGNIFGSIQADMNDWQKLVYPIGSMKIYYKPGEFPTDLTSGEGAGQISAAKALGIPVFVCYQPVFSGTATDPTWPGGADKPAMGNSGQLGTILGDQAAIIASVSAFQHLGVTVDGVVMLQEPDNPSKGISGDQLTYLYYQNYEPFKAVHPNVLMVIDILGAQTGQFNANQPYFPGPTPSTTPNGFTVAAQPGGGTFAAGTYWWQLAGIDPYGRVLTSNEASVTVALNGSVSLAWTNPGGLSSVQVWRGTSQGNENRKIATLAANATTYTDTGLAGTAGTLTTSLYCDGIGVDIYGQSAVNSSNQWVRPAYSGAPLTTPNWADIADFQTPPIAFGWMESGNSAGGGAAMSQARMTVYLSANAAIGGDPVNSIQATYAARIAAGKPVIPFMWYQDDSNTTGPNLIISTVQPDYRIGLLQALAKTMTGGSQFPKSADAAGASDAISVAQPAGAVQLFDLAASTELLAVVQQGAGTTAVTLADEAAAGSEALAVTEALTLRTADRAAAAEGLAIAKTTAALWTIATDANGSLTSMTVAVSALQGINIAPGQFFQLHASAGGGGGLLQPQVFTIISTGQPAE